jgi:hypothetical protein
MPLELYKTDAVSIGAARNSVRLDDPFRGGFSDRNRNNFVSAKSQILITTWTCLFLCPFNTSTMIPVFLEEFYLVNNAALSVKSQPTFRRNISPRGSTYYLLSSWFLTWFIFWPWKRRQYVTSKLFFIIRVVGGGVQLGPRGTSVTNWPIVSARVIMIMENLVEWWLAGETEVLGVNLPQCHFVHHKSHMTWPGANPGRSGGNSAINRLSYGTALRNFCWLSTDYTAVYSRR